MRLSKNRLNIEDGRVDNAVFKDHAEIALGSSSTVFTGTAYTINIQNGQTYSVILNADCAFTFANPTGSGNVCSFTLILKQDQIGGWNVAWPTGMRWQGGITPSLATAPGDFDILTFFTVNGGTNWIGAVGYRDHLNGVGELWSWGDNTDGQLGLNDRARRSSPTQVGSGTNWYQIASGEVHVAAVKTDGTLWTWGGNYRGQLGINSRVYRSSPTQIGTDTNWQSVAAGWDWTLATKTNGTLWGMGWNGDGQLGISVVTHRSSPTQIGTATDWRRVFTGFQASFGIKTNGTLWAWGYNTFGRLGTNDATNKSSPTQVGALTTWKGGDGGAYQTVFMKTDGSIWTVGQNAYGVLGSNSTTWRSSPNQVGSGQTWASVTMGGRQAAGVTTSGELWSWGENTYGQLGSGTTTHRSSPAQVGTGTTWTSVSGSFMTFDTVFAVNPDLSHTTALQGQGVLWTWGAGDYGRLGNALTSHRSSPAQVGSRSNWRMIVGGDSTTFGLRTPPTPPGEPPPTPEFVGGKTHTFAGTTGTTAITLTDLSGGVGTSPTEGDLVIVCVAIGSGIDTDINVTMSTSGYTELYDIAELEAPSTANLGIFYKLMSSSPDTTVTIGSTVSTANAAAVAIHVWRGVDQSTPIDSSGSTFGNDTPTASPPDITPTTPGAVVICAAALSGATITGASTGTGYDNFLSDIQADTNDAAVALGSIGPWTSGVVTTPSFGAATGADVNTVATFAIRPAT